MAKRSRGQSAERFKQIALAAPVRANENIHMPEFNLCGLNRLEVLDTEFADDHLFSSMVSLIMEKTQAGYGDH